MPIGIRRTPIWALLLGLVLLVACSPGETMTCRDGYEKFAEHRMFFGRGSGEVERVSDTDWERFLAEVLTPRFPDGLTVMDGAGQWREDGTIIHIERTKVVVILTPREASVSAKLHEISDEYKRLFNQGLVLITSEDSCAAFN